MKKFAGLTIIALFAAGSQTLAQNDSMPAAPQTAAAAGATAASPDSTAESLVFEKKNSGQMTIIKNGSDTLYCQKDPSEFRKHSRKTLNKSRNESRGISGGLLLGAGAIGSKPVKDLLARVTPYSERDFGFNNVDNEAMPLRGGFGFLGVGNGVRLGGGGQGGDRYYVSDRFNGDSVVALKLHIGYGGFLVEKAFVADRWNMITGGYLGSGQSRLTASTMTTNDYSLFKATAADNDDDTENENTTTASFMYLELHGGATYTIVPFLHFGAEVSVPAFYSVEGFQAFTGDFLTINPVIRLRIVLGNLG